MSGTIDMETFVLDILNVIEFEQLEDIILVGHSFGARTVSGVVDRAPSRIRRTVFLDGGLPLDGLSRLDSMTAEARDARIKSAMNFDGGISVPPPPPGNFGIVDPQMSHRVKSLLTPHPLNTERTAVPLKNPLGNGRPTTYVRCIDPAFPAVEISARHARSRSDWRYVELGAGHDAMLTHPQLLAELLLAEAAS